MLVDAMHLYGMGTCQCGKKREFSPCRVLCEQNLPPPP